MIKMMTLKEYKEEDRHFLEKVKDIITDSSYVKNGQKFSKGPANIIDHVYLGNKQDAYNIPVLKRLKITHVLNCAESKQCKLEGAQEAYKEAGIKYLGIEAFDHAHYPILMHFRQAKSYIDSCLNEGGRVLVHCEMGVNRSGAICVAYLMVHESVTLLQALRRVKYERPVVLVNEGFQKQLIEFARERDLLHKKAKCVY